MKDLFNNMGQLFNEFDEATQFSTHKKENNAESQANLEKHKGKFNRQMQAIFDYLMTGAELDSLTAMMGLKVKQCTVSIGHLPRRILDLKEKGVRISSVQHKNGTKTWFMTDEDRAANQKYCG